MRTASLSPMLARMIDLNEERTAHILRKWAHQEAV
jgi:flagellar M-ring protein FliF